MKLEYKPDFSEVQARLRAWFAHEDETPILQVFARKRTAPERELLSGWTLVHNLDNPDRAFDLYESYMRETFYGGQAFPNLFINLGPGIPAAYLGREPHITENTVWFEGQEAMPWDEILSKRLDPQDKWWRITRDLTARAAERGRGKFFSSVTDLNGVLNNLGSLRGTQQLLVDCIDTPELVKKATTLLTDIWLACFDELMAISRRYQEGSSNWMNIWFPGIGSDVQCDFSAMISPAMFEEFVMPDLVRQVEHMDQSIFHWDGPGQIPHLDHLLSIKKLSGLQWVPGAGNPDTGSPKWFPLYERILRAGKLLVLQGMDPAGVEGVLRQFGRRGLLITVRCASEDEARELLAAAPKWVGQS
jgi:5-methyltetrahydrofolate--homocysteine methyltransferase